MCVERVVAFVAGAVRILWCDREERLGVGALSLALGEEVHVSLQGGPGAVAHRNQERSGVGEGDADGCGGDRGVYSPFSENFST